MQEPTQVAPSKESTLKDIQAAQDLFARAHDYISQSSHPGHLGLKVAEVDAERNLLLIAGPVPGSIGGIVEVRTDS